MSAWSDLFANLAIVALVTTAWNITYDRWTRLNPTFSSVIFGLMMAVGILAVMLFPFQFLPGVNMDARYSLIAIAGFIGGPLAALPCVIVAVVRRVYVGGIGVSVAVPQIIAAAGVGLAGFRLLRGRIPSVWMLCALATCVAVSGTAGFYIMHPYSEWGNLMRHSAGPLALVLFFATLISGLGIVQEVKRHATMGENQMYRSIIEALPDCLNAKDLEGRFIAANPATANLLGVSDIKDIIGRTDADFFPHKIAAEFRDVENKVLTSRNAKSFEQQFTKLDGADAWLMSLKAPLYDADGSLRGTITHSREIGEQKRLEREFSLAQHLLTIAVASMSDGLAMYDRTGTCIYSNPKFEKLMEDPFNRRKTESAVDQALVSFFGTELECQRQSDPQVLAYADGRWVQMRPRAAGKDHLMVLLIDVTEQKANDEKIRAVNAQLASLANTDALTGLANRRAFDQALQVSAGKAQTSGSLGLLMIDLDHFKSFNDTYGHPVGDKCLRQVSRAVAQLADGFIDCVVARYGGEELAVILPGLNLAQTVAFGQLVCATVRDLNLPHAASPLSIVTVSVGAASSTGEAVYLTQELVDKADKALYLAKFSGRDRVETITVENHNVVRTRHSA